MKITFLDTEDSMDTARKKGVSLFCVVNTHKVLQKEIRNVPFEICQHCLYSEDRGNIERVGAFPSSKYAGGLLNMLTH